MELGTWSLELGLELGPCTLNLELEPCNLELGVWIANGRSHFRSGGNGNGRSHFRAEGLKRAAPALPRPKISNGRRRRCPFEIFGAKCERPFAIQTPSSKLQGSSSKLRVQGPSSEFQVPSQVPSSKFQGPRSKLQVPSFKQSSKLQVPSCKFQGPNSKLQDPRS